MNMPSTSLLCSWVLIHMHTIKNIDSFVCPNTPDKFKKLFLPEQYSV